MASMIETSNQAFFQDTFLGSSKHVRRLSGSTISGGSSLNHSGIFSGRKIERSLSFDETESKLFQERIASDVSLQSISQGESRELSEEEGHKEAINPPQSMPNHIRALSKGQEIQTPFKEEVEVLVREEMEKQMAKMQETFMAAMLQQKKEKDLQIEKLKKKLISNEEILQSNARFLKDYNKTINAYSKTINGYSKTIDAYKEKLDC